MIPPKPRRRAKVLVDEVLLSQVIDLPPGVRVVALETRNDPYAIHVIVEGDSLPIVPPDCEAPIARYVTLDPAETKTPRVQVAVVWPTDRDVYGDSAPAPMCPECRQGKPDNCTGVTLDPATDDMVVCATRRS